MKFNLIYLNKIWRKNLGLISLVSLSIITIFVLISYNYFKQDRIQKYEKILENIYFDKTLKNIFSNLDAKYYNIEHKISAGDTLDKILKTYDIPSDDIKKI